MTVRCINAVKANTEPTFGYYIDTTNHYIYFGIYSPPYRGESRITVLANNNVTLRIFKNNTTAPTGWTTVTPTGVSSAVKLDTARTIQTDLASTSSAGFDGTANITPGVTGTLPVANGGTGATTPAGAQFNLIDKATTELSPMEDNHRIAIMSPEPSATNSVIAGYRTGLTMWNYMKGKMSSDTGVNISGNAATAGTADKSVADKSGNDIETTYATKSELSTHKVDTTVHITAAERTAWNAKASTSVATTSANGLMSKTDKAKLDGISSGANKADVSYASKKLTKTINGTTTDVVAASTIISDTNTFGNFAAVTDVTVSNIKFHTYWQVAPTSSNIVYGFAVHPTNGKLYRVYNNKGSYSVYSYDTDTNTTYSFDGTYNSSTNKAATVSSVTTRIATAKEELTAAIDTVDAKGIVINEINGENVICFE